MDDTTAGPPAYPELLTSGEVAEIYQISSSTVDRWTAKGKLPYFRTLGGHRRYRLAEINRILQDQGRPVPPALCGHDATEIRGDARAQHTADHELGDPATLGHRHDPNGWAVR